MKPHSMFAPFLLLFAILIITSHLQAGASKPPSAMWKPPDGKTIEIERFSREGPNEVLVERYKLGVLVPGKDTVGGVDCWKLTFLPGEDTPATQQPSTSR